MKKGAFAIRNITDNKHTLFYKYYYSIFLEQKKTPRNKA